MGCQILDVSAKNWRFRPTVGCVRRNWMRLPTAGCSCQQLDVAASKTGCVCQQLDESAKNWMHLAKAMDGLAPNWMFLFLKKWICLPKTRCACKNIGCFRNKYGCFCHILDVPAKSWVYLPKAGCFCKKNGCACQQLD